MVTYFILICILGWTHFYSVESTEGKNMAFIVGGIFSTTLDAPWHAAILLHGNIHCGGTLIGNRWVLTAAHCFFLSPGSPLSSWSIALATDDLRNPTASSETYGVRRIEMHNRFNKPSYANDIALVELNRKVQFRQSRAKAIKLANKYTRIRGSTCSVFGYGKTETSWWSSKIKRADVPLVDGVKCQKMHCKPTSNGEVLPVYTSNICAGNIAGGADACQGDSGGGLICSDIKGTEYLVGVISHGDECGAPNRPGLYTRVESYIDWIKLAQRWNGLDKYRYDATLEQLQYKCDKH